MNANFIFGFLIAAVLGILLIAAFDSIDRTTDLRKFTAHCEGIAGEVVDTPKGYACVEQLIVIDRRITR
jgi:hypothetical protein